MDVLRTELPYSDPTREVLQRDVVEHHLVVRPGQFLGVFNGNEERQERAGFLWLLGQDGIAHVIGARSNALRGRVELPLNEVVGLQTSWNQLWIIGDEPAYKKKETTNSFLWQLMSLPFLPLQYIRPAPPGQTTMWRHSSS
ncbi:hypothetical protein ScPMuIL_012788 [Solemya velum]